MEKRLPLFLFLAFLVFFLWNLAFPPPPKAKTPEVAPIESQEPGPAGAESGSEEAGAGTSLSATAPALAADAEDVLELLVGGAETAGEPGRRGAYRARFTNRGARLLSLDLADFVRSVDLDEAQRRDMANWLPLLESIETPTGSTGSLLWDTRQDLDLAPGGLGQALWVMEELPAPAKGVRFRYGPPGGKLVLEKTIAFEPGTWHLAVTLTIENKDAGAARPLSFTLVPGACVPAELGDRFYPEPLAIAIGRASPSQPYVSRHEAAPGLKESGALEVPTPLGAVGVANKYFAFLLREAKEGLGTLGGATYEPLHEVGTARSFVQARASLNLALPAPGQSRSWEYVVYAGPKDGEAFVNDFAAHRAVLDDDITGSFGRAFQVDHIAKSLLYVLGLFHGLVGNWGLAIILLTLCVRAVLFPLNRRSQTSMARYQKKMKRVQPRLEEVKKRFEKDPQKLREAQARIMQEEGAFPPLGGCLPMFLQMPIFFGLFSALRTSFDLRQAPFFGWIHDLSRPDRLLHIQLPYLPEYLNILPILMVVLWIVQQMGQPKPADEQAARMQKMMMFMPAVFGFMLYNYAAGLSLYMITTSSCSIVEQKVIKKFWPIDDTERAPKEKPGCGPFSGIMQNLAEKQREQMKRMQAMEQQRRRQDGKRRK